MTPQPTSSVGSSQSHVESPLPPVALFVATRWELAALRRALPVIRQEHVGGLRCLVGQSAERAYWLIQTGVGQEAAQAAAGLVLNRQPMALAISAGFAGALTPAAIGDLIVGTSVSSAVYDGAWKQAADSVSCAGAVVSGAQAVAAQLGIAVRIGPVVSVPEVVCRAEDKQSLGRATGATAVDMESMALARVARERAVPFMVLRTVSDLAGEDLPLDFNLFLRPSGWLRGTLDLIRHPSSLIGLNRLRRQSNLAADRLTAVCALYAGRGFGLPPAAERGRT